MCNISVFPELKTVKRNVRCFFFQCDSHLQAERVHSEVSRPLPQRPDSTTSSPGSLGVASARISGVLPDLLPQQTSTPSHSTPSSRSQDKTTSDEVIIFLVN